VTAKQALEVLKSAGSKWNYYNAPRLGAALAYYALLSLAPLLVLLVTAAALAFNQATAEQELLADIRDFAGSAEAQTMKTFLDSAHHAAVGTVASTIALVTLLFGASGVFVELRDSLNLMWGAPAPRSSAWRNVLRERLTSFLMILGLGLLLVASLAVSTAAALIKKSFAGVVSFHGPTVSDIAARLGSLLAVAAVFALVLRFVPAVRLGWREVAIGAVLTAVLFELGKSLLALYIGTAGVGSAYGAAGSLIALVVWVYYSAQIFFFGAAFTRAYAEFCRSRSGEGSKR
jgi:membrane protein